MTFVPVCCFCTRGVSKKGLEPLSLAVFAAKGDRDTEQTFWCHRRCLAKAFQDPTILREELGGPKLRIDWSKAVRVEGGRGLAGLREAIKTLKARSASTHQNTHQSMVGMGRKSKIGPNERKAGKTVLRRKTGS